MSNPTLHPAPALSTVATDEVILGIYRTMVAIREFEERLYNLFLTETMPGTMHQYTGEEAVAAGVCAALRPDDYVTSTHRGHGHAIAKGVTLRSLMAEMFARDTGCCRGMGGSMHLADPAVGMLGATGIVGGGIPIATGAALSAQMRRSGQVSVSFFGDGAANEGSFHESLNQAGAWKLPAIYVCENNLYGFSVPFSVASAVPDIARRAESYGFPGVVVDGMDALAVYAAAAAAVARARSGAGPTLLECKTYRYRGHSRFEKPNYRTDEEVRAWQARDPIARLETYLSGQMPMPRAEPRRMKTFVVTTSVVRRRPRRLKSLLQTEPSSGQGPAEGGTPCLDAKGCELIRAEIRAALDDAVAFARTSPEPPADAALRYVFSAAVDPRSL